MTTEASEAEALGLWLDQVRLEDFRAVEDLWLPIGRITVFLGENNSGKTTVLRAIGIALGEFQVSEDDFRVEPDGSRLAEAVVDLKFIPGESGEFDEQTRQRFDRAIQGVAEGEEFIAVRALLRHREDARGVTVERRFLGGWARERSEAAKLPTLGSSVGVFGRHLEHMPFSYLGPSRDVVSDMRNRSSNWGRMISDLDLPEELRSELEAELAAIGERIVGESALLDRLRTELEQLAGALSAGVDDVLIAPVPATLTELSRGVDVHAGAPGGRPLPMRLQGMGARSLASMMVFRAFAAARLVADDEIHARPITAYEEPEAHLHPQSQRAVSETLHELPGQVLISTHSPIMVDAADPFDWRLLRHSHGRVSVGYLTSPAAQVLGSSDEDLRHAASLLVGRQRDALFGRVVVAVEGETEDCALSCLAKGHWGGTGLHGRGVSVVNSGGAQTVPAVVRILHCLGIPWLALVDDDLEGQAARERTLEVLGAAADTHAEQILVLPAENIESYFAQAEFSQGVANGIAQGWGDSALEDWRELHHGSPAKKGVIRDYESDDWEVRLQRDFLAANKPTWPIAVIDALLADGAMPDNLVAVLTAADALLEESTDE